MSNKLIKWCGVLAIVGGVLACLLTPLMSVGYYQSYAIQAETPPFWFSAAQPLMGFLFSFADEKTAYTTYGKLFAIIYLLFLPGVFGLHSVHSKASSPLEKFGFVFLVIALVACFFGVSGDYWGIKQGWTLELLGMLLLQVTATLYGVAILRLKIVPIWCALLLVCAIPLCVISFLLFKQIPSAPTLPFAVATIAFGFFVLGKSKTIENSKAENFLVSTNHI